MRVHNISKLWVTNVFLRNALVALAAFFAAFFLTLVFPSADAYANDATWEGGSVVYNGDTYQGPRQAADGNPPGIPDGATYYEYLNDGTARVVYFEEDPTNASAARTATYSVSDGNYTQTSRGSTITIDRQVDVEADTSEGDENITSCVVNGIGYILCPMIQFLAEATDTVFGYLENFLQVEPLIADRESTLYQAWSIARNVANLAFIIVFMVVIYSHLTSVGLNNYDIKRTIPRLLVAAVAVNLSYYICAFLVDASNIVGSSLNQMFITIVNEIGQGAEQNVLASASFGEIATYVLSGGTLVAAGLFQGAVALSGMGMGILFLFIVVLVPIAVIILVTVTVLAARLAIITVLIVLAPLAFVAYVLPGTKKMFDKWQDLFTTMLLMYPMFAVLFGGSHLASYLIAQNADRWETILIALFVQAVPLVITPFLIKFSGRLLGNFAGMVNNPTKGLADRTKNWARDRASESTERRMAANSVGSGIAQWNDSRKRNREGKRKRYEERNALRFSKSRSGRALNTAEMINRDDQNIEANYINTEYELGKLGQSNEKLIKDPDSRLRALRLKESEMQLELQKSAVSTHFQELQSAEGRYAKFGDNPTGDAAVYAKRAESIGKLSQHSIAMSTAEANANNAKRIEYANVMQNAVDGDALRRVAAGITGEKGTNLAVARGVQEVRADFGKTSGSMAEMMDHYKLSGDEIRDLAIGKDSVVKTDDTGNPIIKFNANDEHVRDAAVETIMKSVGNYAAQKEVVLKSGTQDYADNRATIANNLGKFLERSGLSGQFIDQVRTGQIQTSEDYTAAIQNNIKAAKFKPSNLLKLDAGGAKDWHDAIQQMNLNDKESRQAVLKLKKAANEAITNDNYKGEINASAEPYLHDIANYFVRED